MSGPAETTIIVGEDEPELWKAWSANSAASIMVDGQKLHEVLTAIRSQIEYLRRRQVLLESAAAKSAQSDEAEVTAADEPEIQHFKVVQNHNGPSEEDMRLLFDKLRGLENRSNTFEERLEDIESKMNNKFTYFQNQIQKLSLRIDTNALNEINQERRVKEMEEQFNEKLAAMKKEMELSFHSKQAVAKDDLSDISSRLAQLKDVVDLNDFRLGNTEAKVNSSADLLVEVKSELDTFPTLHLEPIKNNVIELFMEKADKSSLESKADQDIADMKADQTEIERLDELFAELNRKITSFNKDVQDGFSGVDARLEKRMDKLAKWCLKYLKKEIKHLPMGDDLKDGADIGRVRCLVCDQVVVQNRETEIVFGGPQLKSHIPPQRRSPSPPATGERESRSREPHSSAAQPRNAHSHSNSNNNNNLYTAGRPRSAGGATATANRRSYNNILKDPAPSLLPKVTGRASETHNRPFRPQTADRARQGLPSQGQQGPEVEYVTDSVQRVDATPHQVPRAQPLAASMPMDHQGAGQQTMAAATPDHVNMAESFHGHVQQGQGMGHSESAPLLQVKNPFNQQPIDQAALAAAASLESIHAHNKQQQQQQRSGSHPDLLSQSLPVSNYLSAQEENQKYFRDLEEYVLFPSMYSHTHHYVNRILLVSC